jgi:hypothetical protein
MAAGQVCVPQVVEHHALSVEEGRFNAMADGIISTNFGGR